MDEDLPLWPHFLENDYAFMFHRLLNTKRFYGSLFLYYGNSSLPEHKRPLWFELVGAISEQTLLHVSASYMALNFRKFVSGKQKDYTDNLDLDRIDQMDDRLQNMYVDSGSLSSGNAAEARWYSEETGKYMAETELFFEADALRTKEELAREEAEAYARCTWAGISIMVALAGGLLNMFAIRSFVAHFVREVKITATEHKNKSKYDTRRVIGAHQTTITFARYIGGKSFFSEEGFFQIDTWYLQASLANSRTSANSVNFLRISWRVDECGLIKLRISKQHGYSESSADL